MPRSQDGKGTEIEVLQGSGDNLSEIPDLDFFYDKMYRALNVPAIRRQGQESQFRGMQPGNFEIEREEIKFFKFVVGLRKKFNQLFLDILKKELISTKTVSLQDWEKMRNIIKFNYKNNNEYAEIKNLQTMKTYLKDHTGLIMFGVIFVVMGLAHCSSPEHKSRTVDEIIIENRLKADSLNSDSLK